MLRYDTCLLPIIALVYLLLCNTQAVMAAVTQAIDGGCRMAYMSPLYFHLEGVPSRLSKKYSLHLYREAGWDLDLSNGVHGVPVLFIPGNAGSYKQVRSIAAAAARYFYATPGNPRTELWNENMRNLDFFALDFNEDFSAFHGETLFEQAEYATDAIAHILSLYEQSGQSHIHGPLLPKPTSVIILAHSMGGIVARHLFLNPQYRQTSINTIITLSTPHLYPPAPVDSSVERFYTLTNDYWTSYRDNPTSSHPLAHVTLISVSGGTADLQITSDATIVESLVPPQNGFTQFTTSIPDLYSPVEHVVMIWCDQLRHRIASMLVHMVDARQGQQTKSIEDRLAIARKHLLGEQPIYVQNSVESGFQSRINFTPAVQPSIQFITSSPHVTLQACQGKECKYHRISDLAALPASFSDRITSNQDPPMYFGQISSTDFGPATSISLGLEKEDQGFLVAGEKSKGVELQPDISLLSVILHGAKGIVPSGSIKSELVFPDLDSALIVYRFELVHEHLQTCRSAFAPLLQVRSQAHVELHYFPNIHSANIHLHGKAPFLPPTTPQAMRLILYRDPACAPPASYRLGIAWRETLWTTLMHYRLVLVAWPVAVALLILREQSKMFMRTGTMPTFFASLLVFTRQQLPYWCVSTYTMALLQAFALQAFPRATWVRNSLLGNDRPIFAVLVPLFLVLATLVVAVLGSGTTALLQVLQGCWLILGRFVPIATSLLNLQDAPSSTRRLASVLSLLLLVIFFAPYQFAFLVLTLLCLLVTQPSNPYHFTILLLWLLAVPIKGPILMVWIRNLGAGWWAPFSSDHNIFPFLGFLLWYEAAHASHQGGQQLPIQHEHSRAGQLLLYGMVAIAGWTLLYGLRFAYHTPALVNVLLLCLAGLHWLGAR